MTVTSALLLALPMISPVREPCLATICTTATLSVDLAYIALQVHCPDSTVEVIYKPEPHLMAFAGLVVTYTTYIIARSLRKVPLVKPGSIPYVLADMLLLSAAVLLLPLPDVLRLGEAMILVLLPLPLVSAVLILLSILVLLLGGLVLAQRSEQISEVFVSLDELTEQTLEEEKA